MTSALDSLLQAVGNLQEPIGWLPPAADGRFLCLARERGSGALVAIALPADWRGEPERAREAAVLHRLPQVAGGLASGRAVAADDPATGGLSRAQLMEAVSGGAAGAYEILGDLPREPDGALIYVARARADGLLYALRLAPERQPDGSEEFVLAAEVVTGHEPPPATVEGANGVPAVGPEKVCPQCEATYPADVRFCPVDGSTLIAAAPSDDLVGQVIADRYHVERMLGEGGMGRVYLAEHVRMGRRSAVKVMGRSLVTDRDALSRFNREAANASRISHSHVAAIYDFGETRDGLVYLAMEYVDGEPLTSILRRETRLDPARAARIVAQVGDGLDAAHTLGIVHRDLKPDNIMITAGRDGDDWVKIVDFGIAKDARGGEGQQVTKTGLVIGTPEYMSPEQLMGEAVDARSDVYSLALVAFALLTGELPFASGTTEQLFMSRLGGKPRTLAEVAPDATWPPAVQAVFDRALARETDARPATAGEFGLALVNAVREGFGQGAAGTKQPAGAAAAGGRKGAGAVPATQMAGAGSVPAADRSARKPASTSGRRGPLLAVAALVLVVAAGGGAWALLGGSGEGAGTTTAAADSTAPVDGGTGAPSSGPQAAAEGAPDAGESAQAELERISKWTDVAEGNAASARRALDAIPGLRARLSTAADSVEADFYAAQASFLLDDMEGTCRQARALLPRAEAAQFLVEAVRAMANACP